MDESLRTRIVSLHERGRSYLHSGEARSTAMVALALADRLRPGDHVGCGWPGGHAGRNYWWSAQVEPAHVGLAGRPVRDVLSDWRCAGRTVLWLGDGSPGKEEAIHRHATCISAGDRGNRVLMEFRELLRLPIYHGPWYRRRIRCH